MMQKLDKEEFLSGIRDLKKKRVGYVSIVGRPNVGKSTFLNALIGEKVSIVSTVPQTTRKKVLGIYNDEDSQIVFFDTPGIHKDTKSFNQAINKEAISTLNTAEAILYFIDSTREGGEEESYIKEQLANVKVPVIKVYTKLDLDSKITLPENGLKISSMEPETLTPVVSEIKKYLKEDFALFPEEYYTTSDVYFRISEIIREKVFRNTKEEIPHASFVGVEEYEDKGNLLKISAYVYVETESQKYIVVGKNGSLITKIGKEAREDLEEMYGKKVFLSLRVKKLDKWRKKEGVVKKMFD